MNEDANASPDARAQSLSPLCLSSAPCVAHALLTVLALKQVMAPLLDTNHELNWQANMVDAIERKSANQHTEGPPVLPCIHST